MNSNNARKGTLFAMLAVCALTLAACAKKDGPFGFDTPEAAFEALVSAIEQGDITRAKALLGPNVENLLESGDPVQDKSDQADFVAAYKAKHSVQGDGEDQRTLLVGENDWPLPIPAVRRNGKWWLDGQEGSDELIYRRVGENELGAIAVARGFVESQNEYAAMGHDGDPPGIYALKLVSDPGLQNGLYWETSGDEPPSPAGEFVAAAASEGYRRGPEAAYHGYRYRMLYKQGVNAKSGAREYFKDGLLTQGYALVAWPADYGSTGVMTFIVNQDGDVYQKDLGADTGETVKGLMAYDPDSSWKLVAPSPEG